MHFEHKSHFTAATCHRTQTHTQNLKPQKLRLQIQTQTQTQTEKETQIQTFSSITKEHQSWCQ